MAELKLKQGDLVEVYNDVGATQAMVYPTPTAKRKETFMLFASPSGTQGNVINAGVNELILPNYKQTWANIRKISDAPASVQSIVVQVLGLRGILRNTPAVRSNSRAAFSISQFQEHRDMNQMFQPSIARAAKSRLVDPFGRAFLICACR